MRWFNTAGPCDPWRHYTLLHRQGLPDLSRLVERGAYFVVHAPRQTGKTTALLRIARELTEGGRYAAVMLSVEAGQPFSRDLEGLEPAILGQWREQCRSRLPPDLQPPPWPEADRGARLGAALGAWAREAPRPLVLFLDEVDAIRDDALVLLLRQLRAGYPDRPRAFPHSLALVGLREVRDYVVAHGEGGRLGTASPFNIKTASIRLGDFTGDEVAHLLGQHTDETGQVFEPAALARIVELTRGQPWLVNSLAAALADDLVPDRTRAISVADVERARELLVASRETHLDSLAARLQEPRVRAVVEPILAGTVLDAVPEDDRQYAVDLGLVRRRPEGGFEVANPIYAEILPRFLTGGVRDTLPLIAPSWLDEGGRLDPDALLAAFLDFWRRHGEALLGAAPYHEIAPHLVLMAFLDRVANGGGSVEREYAIGRGRMDLLLRYGDVRLAIELKVWRPGEPDPREEGLAQLDGYLDGLGLDTGWLVLFDRRPGLARAAQRTAAGRERTPGGREVVVVRA